MGSRLTGALVVGSMFNPPALAGNVRRRGPSPVPHPADGMTADVAVGGGAFMTIIDPGSFADGGPEWTMRYGNAESIRYTVASLLGSYDYLLSGEITTAESIRRLRLLRAARAALNASKPEVQP